MKKICEDWAFGVARLEEWNKLPLDLKRAPSLETFQIQIKDSFISAVFPQVFFLWFALTAFDLMNE